MKQVIICVSLFVQFASATEGRFFSSAILNLMSGKAIKGSEPVTVISNEKIYPIAGSNHFYFAPKKNVAEIFKKYENFPQKNLSDYLFAAFYK